MKDQTDHLKQLGAKETKYPDEPSQSILEVFPNQFPGRVYQIRFESKEFTSLCPKTGQPDFGTIVVHYRPGKWCIETKSLKLYLFSYRNHQSFMESIVNNIMDDFITVVDPDWVEISGAFTPRGGIYGIIQVQHNKVETE